MRVEPELSDHPKFLRLKKIVGEGAMEFLVRLWGHCQGNQRGEHWPSADADYVEMICRWDGQPGVLFKALTDCGRPGFVECVQDGIVIHDWEEMNSQTVNNWRRNLNGRAVKNPTGSQREPVGSPRTNPRDKVGLNGGSKPKTPEPVANPRGTPLATPTGTQGEPSALSVSPSVVQSSPPNAGSQREPVANPRGTPMVQDDFELSRGLVALLNELTGSRFDPPIQELDAIAGRMIEVNRDWAGVEKMLRRQVALWKNDAKARHWLKPGTLFGSNFHDYYGQRELPVAAVEKNAPPARTPAQARFELGKQLEEVQARLDAAHQNSVAPDLADVAKEKKLRGELAVLQTSGGAA